MGIDFKVIYLEKNQGHGNARRISVQNCNTDLIALMDADDISYLNRFEKQISFIKKHNEVNVLGGQITEFIDQPDNKIGRREVPCTDKEIKQYMKKRCPMNQVSVMFRKSFYDEVGGYIDWYCEEDYYLWIRMFEANGIFANLPDDLVNVRIGDEMSARRGGLKYFRSEAAIQKYMYKKKIINLIRYLYNIFLRFCGEVVLTNKLRTFLFKIIRSGIDEKKIVKDINTNSKKEDLIDFPFSVSMCVYNGDSPENFDEALFSIFNQTFLPAELVLVVDGPINNSLQKIIDSYKDKSNYE